MRLPHVHSNGLVLWVRIVRFKDGAHWHILKDIRKPGTRESSVLWSYVCLCGNVVPDAIEVMAYHALNEELPFCDACVTLHNQKEECR